jgi:DNA-binding MarR family transcriptional regulator
MTDVSEPSSSLRRLRSPEPAPSSASPAQTPSDEALIAYAELLFFAYRDFTGDADAVLATYGFGRAHHRVLHFVNRRPGLRVAHLLDILKITKQSLARVLKDLIDKGFVTQRAGAEDRRERLLYLTARGSRLADKLSALQTRRIATALAAAGPGADAMARRFLLSMIAEDQRAQVEYLVGAPRTGASCSEKA